jgi:hypothetical protein
MGDTCTETYKECTAARQARVERVIAERQPWDTQEDLAQKAEVSVMTIRRLLQNCSPEQFCNSEDDEAPYEPKIPWEEQPEIVAFRKAFHKLETFQRAYVWKHVLSNYDPGPFFRRKVL